MSSQANPESGVFRMPQRILLNHLFRKHGRWWLLVTAAAVVGFISAAFILGDVRFAILALMFAFIIFPMAMAFIYINFSLKPDIAFNSIPHSVKLTDERIQISIFPEITPKEEDKNQKKKRKKRAKKSLWEDDEDPNSEDRRGTDPESRPGPLQEAGSENNGEEKKVAEDKPAPVFKYLSFGQIGEFDALLNSVIIKINDNLHPERREEEGFLFLPSSAFTSIDAFKDFIEQIYARTKSESVVKKIRLETE